MSTQTYSPIVELRQYTLHHRQRETLIELFDREFVETQEAVGIQVIGQFRDLDDPDRFVWLRGFNDMPGRAQSLQAFYSGPVWKEHRNAANATMIDSDDVLLLRPARLNAGFSLNGHHLPVGDISDSPGLVSATICHFDTPATAEFISYFETVLEPELSQTGADVRAYFVTHDSPNTFPALPVREGEHVFVWFSGFQDQASHKSHWGIFTKSSEYTKLLRRIKGKPEQLRLSPTSRSRLR